MKKLTLLCLALPLLAADPTPTPTPTQPFSLAWASESGIILSVQGIESDRIAETQSAFGFQHYARPEKPDDAKVELWTKDGRHWKAQWVEVKP